MANHCSNFLVIETSVRPELFLTPVLNEKGEIVPGEWTFEWKDSICPFNDPSGKDTFPFWWTKWIDTHDVQKEDITIAPPPELEPIMITEWTRRYPLYTGPKKKPYKYTRWEITFTSAWAPPENYMSYLFTFLKSIDDRTHIIMYFEEPWCDILWYWEDDSSYYDAAPSIYRTTVLNNDVMDKRHVPASWAQFNDLGDYYTPEEALEELAKIPTQEAREEIDEIKSMFSLE